MESQGLSAAAALWKLTPPLQPWTPPKQDSNENIPLPGLAAENKVVPRGTTALIALKTVGGGGLGPPG
jgi:hypothetical protein